MNESDVSRKLRVALNDLGFWSYKASDRFHASIPDILGCLDGRFIAIEVKIHPNKPTNLQLYTMEELRAHGAAVFVVAYNQVTKSHNVVHNGVIAIIRNNKDVAKWVLNKARLTNISTSA